MNKPDSVYTSMGDPAGVLPPLGGGGSRATSIAMLRRNSRSPWFRQFQKHKDRHGDYDDKKGAIESLDYDDFENKINMEHVKGITERDTNILGATRWVFTILVGILTGLFGFFINMTGQPLLMTKLQWTSTLMSMEQSGSVFHGASFLVYLVFSCTAAVISATFVAMWEPMASGAGVPEIKTLLNGVKIHRAVRIKTLICKTIALPFSLASNLPFGKVGPLIHIGGILGAGISQGKSSTIGIDTSITRFAAFRNDKEKRDFIACGTAAGVAASFGAPIGGMLFTIESGASFFELTLVWRLFVCSLVSCYVLTLLTQYVTPVNTIGGFEKSMLSFGTFTIENDSYSLPEVFIFLIMGAAGGLIGAFVNDVNKHINLLRMKYNIVRGRAILEALVVAFTFSSLSFLFAFLWGECFPLPTTTVAPYAGNLVQFYCGAGEFNDLASLLITTPSIAIKQLFHTPQNLFLPQSLVIFFVLYTGFLIWVYGMLIPGGNFVPNVVSGSVFGRLINLGIVMLSGGTFTVSSQNVYALMGAASFLGGIGRNPVSLTIMLLECVGDIQFGLPLMVTLISARWIGMFFGPSLFDIHIALRRLPFLPWDPPFATSNFPVKAIMHVDPICLQKRVQVGLVYDLLMSCSHNGFPVVDQHPLIPGLDHFFRGYILRHHLTSLLKYKKTFYGREEDIAEEMNEKELSHDDIEKMYPRYPNINKIAITDEERDMWLDLSPYYNPTPYTIKEEMTINRSFKLFRRLGLRHLIVLDDYNSVKGIVTRKDFNATVMASKIQTVTSPSTRA